MRAQAFFYKKMKRIFRLIKKINERIYVF
jgi:hypothetical protein